MTATMSLTMETVHQRLAAIAERWALDRPERQRRRELDHADFDELRGAGFLLAPVPAAHGGLWVDVPTSTRPIAEMLRTLARADSSVALVATMHPAVILSGLWNLVAETPTPAGRAWQEQREWVFQTVRDGHLWGTIGSEPGSGGDTAAYRAEARRTPQGEYRLTGLKHFGTGTGMSSFMITQARVEGEDNPARFFMDMRGIAWDGSDGVRIVAPWDGHGMTATQSHAVQFDDFPITRNALPAGADDSEGAGSVAALFTSVIVGIVDVAVATARAQLAARKDSLPAHARVEWTRATAEAWLLVQAYEGILQSVESRRNRGFAPLAGKQMCAELAESVLQRISRVVGGSAFSRGLPYGFWAEDVRALGFLRPPWNLAFDRLYEASWAGPGAPRPAA